MLLRPLPALLAALLAVALPTQVLAQEQAADEQPSGEAAQSAQPVPPEAVPASNETAQSGQPAPPEAVLAVQAPEVSPSPERQAHRAATWILLSVAAVTGASAVACGLAKTSPNRTGTTVRDSATMLGVFAGFTGALGSASLIGLVVTGNF